MPIKFLSEECHKFPFNDRSTLVHCSGNGLVPSDNKPLAETMLPKFTLLYDVTCPKLSLRWAVMHQWSGHNQFGSVSQAQIHCQEDAKEKNYGKLNVNTTIFFKKICFNVICYKQSCLLEPDVSIIIHVYGLTHWGPLTHICVGNLTITGSDNGLSPGERHAIIWTNAGI